jgi:predicted amidohydrolase YtcJ
VRGSFGQMALTVILGLAASMNAQGAPTLLRHVNGYTLSGDHLVQFGTLAFDQGRVLEVGDEPALMRKYPDAKRIDGHGRTLLPGLIDAHGHVMDLGMENTQIQLTGTTSLAEAQERIRAYARAHPKSHWLLGDGWNQELWKLGRFPRSSELDEAAADRPAVLWRVDGHAAWLNTRALRLSGITRSTPDPVGGRIERDADGNATGVLVDKAMDLVERIVPQPTDAERRVALRSAFAHMHSVGLTGVGDAGCPGWEIALYRNLADRGELTVRMYAMIRDTGSDFDVVSKSGPLVGYGDDRLTVRAVKLFADGALGSRGAAMLAPYADMPSQRGLLFMSDDEMEHKVEKALRAGYQVNIHAIGDAANHQVLEAFEHAYAAIDGRALRNRIEHAQVVALTDIPRFKQLDLIASMQPTHATSDKNMAEDRIGRERLKGAYAWRTFLKQGTRIAGGSDFPVESDNPFFGLHAAVTRQDHDDQPPDGWHAEQAMTLLEAFRAFTVDAAYAEHWEQSIGSLEPGKWADFILIDRDLFKVAPKEIWKIQVEQTWFAGRKVYDREHKTRPPGTTPP